MNGNSYHKHKYVYGNQTKTGNYMFLLTATTPTNIDVLLGFRSSRYIFNNLYWHQV
jgi:hypothetical protein